MEGGGDGDRQKTRPRDRKNGMGTLDKYDGLSKKAGVDSGRGEEAEKKGGFLPVGGYLGKEEGTQL